MIEPEITVYLDTSKAPDKKGQYQVFMYVTKYGDKRAKLITGVKSTVENWDSVNRCIKGNRRGNTQIAERVQIVDKICHTADLNKVALTRETLKEEYERQTKGEFATKQKAVKEKKTFWQYYDDWVEESKGRISKQTKKPLSDKTIGRYRETKDTLQGFEKATGYILKADKITETFYNKFSNYMINVKGYKPSHFGFHIKNFKVFLGWFKKRDKDLQLDFEDFEAIRSIPEPKPLKPHELLLFWDAKMPTPTLQKNLDIFLALCSSALRISDYNLIDEVEELDTIEGKVLIGRAKKSGQEFIIPMFNTKYFRFREIYEKYEGKLPKISGQKLNESLVTIQGIIKFKRFTVTSKTARRTFATIGYFTLGISKPTMRRFTGHATDASFDTYVGVDDMEIIKEFREKTTDAEGIMNRTMKKFQSA